MAENVNAHLPAGPRLAVIGSASFWHPDSEEICTLIGRNLAQVSSLVLITGGVGGVGETIGRAFFQVRNEGARRDDRVFHLLPCETWTWDYGTTIRAGSDMAERREILGRISPLYLAIEGGPGTAYEAEVAEGNGALVIPIGRLGGHSAVIYSRLERPAAIDEKDWCALGQKELSIATTAQAAVQAVQACFGCERQ